MTASRKPASKWAWAALAAALCSAPAAPGQQEGGVKFQESIDAALRLGKARKCVTVVYFTSRTCQWCRKMMVGTFVDQRVAALAAKFAWASVDIDAHPDVAALYGVEGSPFFVLLNVEGRVIGYKGGYLTAEQMVTFLGEWANKADAPGIAAELPKVGGELKAKVQAATQPSDLHAVMAEPLELLAKPDRGGRAVLLDRIRDLGPAVWEALVAHMSDKRLAVRAAAGEAVAFATGADLPFEPFAAPQTRAEQVQAWRKWISENKDKAPATRAAARSAATSPATTRATTQPVARSDGGG